MAAYSAEQIAAAIAKIESGGNYTAHSKTSSASGKYQYIDGTWNHYGGYAHAWQAPPQVQDARALADIRRKLQAYGGDAAKVIMSWFLPAAVNNPTLANQVPKGNGISPNQYVARVMKAMGSTYTTGGVNPNSRTTPTYDDDALAQQESDRLKDPMVQVSNLLGILASEGNPDLAVY